MIMSVFKRMTRLRAERETPDEKLGSRYSGPSIGEVLGVEPVSVSHRTGLCSRRQFLPGNGLARPETAPAFLEATAYFARQRLAGLASPAPKPREVKDYSYGARKPHLCRTAWWRTHSTAT